VHKPVAQDWYETVPIGDGVTLVRELHVARWLRCNIWHIRGRDSDVLIDAGMGLRPLKPEITAISGRRLTAIASHCHFDHMGGSHEFETRLGHSLEAHIHAAPTRDATAVGGFVRAETFTAWPYEGFEPETYEVRAAPLTGHLDEGDVVDLGDRHFRVFHLPGHSPGSIALYEADSGILFSGDVVYNGYLFDTVYHSDPEAYVASLNRLRELPVTTVHAGHNRSFGRQKMIAIIDEVLAGGRRMDDLDTWISSHNS
jgi:glyoxylase-like metal-dependent hydrolase (beta-lactamase superfamily II)